MPRSRGLHTNWLRLIGLSFLLVFAGSLAVSCASFSHPPEPLVGPLFEVLLDELPELERQPGDGEFVEVTVGELKKAVQSDEARLALVERRAKELTVANQVYEDYRGLYRNYEDAWREIKLWRSVGASVGVGALVAGVILILEAL
jgi:hypothetical protein